MFSQAELILRVITLRFLVLSQFFRDGMGPFKLILKLNSKFYENRLSKIEYIIALHKSVGHKEIDWA